MFKKITFILVLCWLAACVEPFKTLSGKSLEKLVIEATLTDEDIPQKIRISKSIDKDDVSFSEGVDDLQVKLIVNQKESFLFEAVGNGFYLLPSSFRAKAGNIYQLIFQKTDGTKYQSNEQIMPQPIGKSKFHDLFSSRGIEQGGKQIPSNDVYADFQDSPTEKNYYTWSWKLWERQFVCHTEYSVDYYCNQNCWEIIQNPTWNIYSDEYSNGKLVSNKLIAQIPYYQTLGALLEIKQLSITEDAYKFLKMLVDQAERTGTLVDTPPAAIIGNVKNLTKKEEPVAGFFMVGSANTVNYWLDRKNVPINISPIGLLGRKPNPNNFGATFACIEGPTRTPQKPKGWVD